MSIRECMHGDGYEAEPGKRKCKWHLLLKMPTEIQIAEAAARQMKAARTAAEDGSLLEYPRTRVPKAEWPDGERWCSGCQGFVPLFYCTGSRCKAHNAAASHEGALSAKYGITREDYLALLELQEGKCYVCHQLPRTKRLAVDHDHKTGKVRGLLCADVERGCNHAVLGSLEARSVDGVVAAAYRLIEYIQNPPFDRLKAGPHAPRALQDPQVGELVETDLRRSESPSGTAGQVPGGFSSTAGGVAPGNTTGLDLRSIRVGVDGRDRDAEWEEFTRPQ